MHPIQKKSVSSTREYNLKNLKDLSARLTDVEYFVFFGTLLGYCREGNIIKGDDDIDFYVNIREKKKIFNILEELGFFINIDNTYFAQSSRVFESVTSFADFYFYEDVPGKNYLLERWNFLAQPKNVSAHIHVPKKIVFPVKLGAIENIKFNIPHDIDACCRYLYGANYKTPLTKNAQYVINIVDNKPAIMIAPTTPIFIIVKDQMESLKESIKYFYASIKTPIEIVIHDNNSTCKKTISFLSRLETSGTKIYWSQASDENTVGVSVKDWMSKNRHSCDYIITNPDASFIKSGSR